MSYQLTFADILNITSSPELADGVTPSDLPDGLTKNQSGQEVARANLSARRAKEKGLLMTGIAGPTSVGSFASIALQQSLASKLPQKLEGLGSTAFDLTWKKWDTPPLVPIYALRASAHHTPDKGSIGLPTPSGCSNGGKNHVVGRLDEWGGSSNPFRGTEIGKKRCASFEAWMMGFPMEWLSRTVLGTLSFRPLRKSS